MFRAMLVGSALVHTGLLLLDPATTVSALLTSLHASPLQIGLAVSAVRWGWLLPQFVAGFLATITSAQRLLVVGGSLRTTCLVAISVVLVATTDGRENIAGLVVLLWVMFSLCNGLVSLPFLTLVSRELSPPTRRILLSARPLFASSAAFALLCGGLISGVEQTTTRFAGLFLVTGVLMWIGGLMCALPGHGPGPSPPIAATKIDENVESSKPAASGGTAVIRDPRLRAVLMSAFLSALTNMSSGFYVVVARQLAPELMVGQVVAAGIAGSLAATLVVASSWATSATSPRLVYVLSLFGISVPLCAIGLCFHGPSPHASAFWASFFVLLGFNAQMSSLVQLELLLSMVDPRFRTSCLAVSNTCLGLFAFAPLLAAALYEALSGPRLFSVCVLFGVAQLAWNAHRVCPLLASPAEAPVGT